MLELDAVINHLDLRKVVLVAHDASGPPVIDWSIASPSVLQACVVEHVLLRNADTQTTEAIWLFSTPLIRNVARPCLRCSVISYSVGCISGKSEDFSEMRKSEIDLFHCYMSNSMTYQAPASLLQVERRLVAHNTVAVKMMPKLKEFRRPVRIIFGDADPYLNKGVAQSFHELFPTSELFLLPGARHFVQMDEPKKWHG